jgi:hypothetical protein
VATALAVSWNPFTNSNARATPTARQRRVIVKYAAWESMLRGDFGSIFATSNPKKGKRRLFKILP